MEEATVLGYIRVARSGSVALVREEYAERFAAALIEGRDCVPCAGAGRGTPVSFAYPGGRGLIRRYRRGGAVRLLLRDRYVLSNRPLREFKAHLAAQSRGIRVPPLLGVCWRRSGPFFGGAIATGLLEADHLLDYLREDRPDRAETLRACGTLIRRMHDAGLWHADLQVKNLLIAEEGPVLIDWDKARAGGPVSWLQRARNLLRLRRSFEKNGLDAADYRRLCEGYDGETPPRWLSAVYAVKGYISDLMTGRRA